MQLRATTILGLVLGAALSSAVAAAVPAAVPIITAIAPASVSCDGVTEFADECLTASVAGYAAVKAFDTHKVRHVGAIAAVLALMAFETGEFRYGKNHFPGRPGQGTRNLQMFAFNLEYAKTAAALGVTRVGEILGGGDGGDDPQHMDALVDALNADPVVSLGSGPWFLATKCPQAYALFAGAGGADLDAAFRAYMGCVGASADQDGRLKYWENAKKAFNLS